MNDKEILKAIEMAGRVKTFKPSGDSNNEYATFDVLVERLLHFEQLGLLNKVSPRKNHGLVNRKYLDVAIIGGLTHLGHQRLNSPDNLWLRTTALLISGILLCALILVAILWAFEPSGSYGPLFSLFAFLCPLFFAIAKKN